MYKLLRGIQVAAVFALILGSWSMAFAAGDGCTQEIRRLKSSPTTKWLQTPCNTPHVCNSPAKCTVMAAGSYTVCACPRGFPGFVCKPGFLPNGSYIVISGQSKPLGSAACVNWNCPSVPEEEDCPETWVAASTSHEKLVCNCPGT